MAGKRKSDLGEQLDPKRRAAIKVEAKKTGGRLMEQLPIHGWADQEIGFELRADFVAMREGRAKAGSNMKPGSLIDVVNSESGEVETWGCPAILKNRLEQAQIAKGDSLWITLAGKVESKIAGQPAWDFEVVVYPKGE